METLANFDYDQFRDTYADIKFLEGKRTTNIMTTDKVCLFYTYNIYKIIYLNIYIYIYTFLEC